MNPILSLVLLAVAIYTIYIFVPSFSLSLLLVKWRHRREKIAVLTFDDGPDEPWTSQVLDILKREKVHATFFVLGEKVKKHPELVKRLLDEGHDVGNHTYSHKKLVLRGKRDISLDLISTSNAISKATGKLPTLFRAPHGFRSPFLCGILKRLNLKLIPWTKGIWDTDGSDANRLFERFSKKFRRLEILLVHDGIDEKLVYKKRANTVAVLPRIIKTYRSNGYTFKKVSEVFN